MTPRQPSHGHLGGAGKDAAPRVARGVMRRRRLERGGEERAEPQRSAAHKMLWFAQKAAQYFRAKSVDAFFFSQIGVIWMPPQES